MLTKLHGIIYHKTFNIISSYPHRNEDSNHVTFSYSGCPLGRESYSLHSECSPFLQQIDWCLDEYRWDYLVNIGKVKCTLVQALRLCTGRTACRGVEI